MNEPIKLSKGCPVIIVDNTLSADGWLVTQRGHDVFLHREFHG
jgi:hypothetical protein